MLTIYAGSPPREFASATQVCLGDELFAGLDGLRLIVRAATRLDPAAVEAVAADHPSEWNTLVPGSFPDAPPMSQLAATCSERRLHAESHQVYRVINAVRDAVLAAAGSGGAALVIRGGGRLDIPSLRGLLRFAEATSDRAHVVVGDLLAAPTALAAEVQELRQRLVQAFLERVGQPVLPGGVDPMPAADDPPPSREREWMRRSNAARLPEERAAACLLAMRAAFLSTNYLVGMAAAHRLLAELGSGRPLDAARVRAQLLSFSFADDPGSIGLGPAEVVDHGALFSVAHRYLGMTASFVLDYKAAERHFARAIDAATTSRLRARALLLRALLRVKRLGCIEQGFQDIERGLSELSEDSSMEARVEAAWLYNVRALGHVLKKDLKAASADEKKAIRLVGGLSSTDATHLKVNLVSNMSVLEEQLGNPDRALAIWRRFSQASDAWGDMFFKNHRYREGSLLVRIGRIEEAIAAFRNAYECALRTGDDFYGAHMALGCGSLLMEQGRRDEALSWYQAADERAGSLGDDYLTALAMLGTALAKAPDGRPHPAQLGAVGALARQATSYPGAAAELADVVAGEDPAALLKALPTVRAKLNRPFVPVRLELAPVT